MSQVFKLSHLYTMFSVTIFISTASEALKSGRNYLDAIEDGCMATEQNISVDSVGYGGRYSILTPSNMSVKILTQSNTCINQDTNTM